MTAAGPAAGNQGVRRIAIIGGGMAGLAAAWRLSEPAASSAGSGAAGSGDSPPVEITVYEQSGVLGGKGASVRGANGRIEEHGLHVWLGYYDNAFRLMREVYAALDRPRTAPDCPLQTWRDAFVPAGRVGVEERTDRGWQHWVATFRATSGEPGEPLADGSGGPGSVGESSVGGTASVAEFLRRAVGLLADFSASLLQLHGDRDRQPASAMVVLSGSPRPPAWPAAGPDRDLGGLLQQAQFAAVIAAVEGLRLLGAAVPADTLDLVHDQLARMRIDLEVVVSRGDPSLRRLGELADLVVSCCLGIVGDRLLTDPAGFGAIDDEDFRAWLARHGARSSTLESALVRGMYDLVFAYADGDRERPRFCAGLGLFLAGKFFFDYQGSLFWRMRAGMGDVVFAPLYQALTARGVRFAFGHTLDRLVLDADRRRIDSMIMTRTSRAAVGEKLITVHGLPCFPAEPDPAGSGADVETYALQAEADFHTVVLAASVASLPGPCAELLAHSPRWRTMIDTVATVATQSVQLWLRPSESELGWDFPASTVSGYAAPFDTYASMTHLLDAEDWPADNRPGTLGYLCAVLGQDGPSAAADPIAVVAGHANRFLDDHAGHFWPEAVRAGGFDRGLVLDSYVRANVAGSQRYVQSLPGTQRARLRVDESGYANLVLAGDWTKCGLNAGCIEAAVLSGLEAANTVLGRPLLERISGSWYGVAP